MRKIICVLSILTYKIFVCQGTNVNYSLPQVIPPTFETFNNSRINFESSPNGEFTYQYPINTNDESFFPITINYSSGLKVDDIGGSLGMSWNLNAGGTISRVVKDETDENHLNWKPTSVNESTDLNSIRNAAMSSNSIDTEYDWFNFSLSNGLAGSFYIDKDLNTYIESKDKVKIEISIKAGLSEYGKILEFKLIDKYGNQYYFGGTEDYIEKVYYNSGGPSKERAFTGWSLSKMITNKNEEILFTYVPEYLSYIASVNATFNVRKGCPAPHEDSGYHYSDVIKSKTSIISTKPLLNSISYNNKQIRFSYDKYRNDLSANGRLLTKIDVMNNNFAIKNYIFGYYDIQNLPASTYYGFPYNEASTTSRHFLKSITELEKNTKTEFEYFELDKIPARFSLNADYYGYPNGASNFSPFPKANDDNNFGIFKGFTMVPVTVLSADKKTNPLFASVGNLKKITHPTKGISEIYYEPNSSKGQVSELRYDSQYLDVESNECDPLYNNHTKYFRFESNGSFIEFFNNLIYFDDLQSCGSPNNLRDIHSLKITDITNGGNSIIFSGTKKIADLFTAEENTNNYPIQTQNGHFYKVEYSTSSFNGVIRGSLEFKFNKRNEMTEKTIYFGGNRVSSINESNVENNSYLRKFYYSPVSEIGMDKASIMDYSTSFIMAQKSEYSKICQTFTFPDFPVLDIYNAYQNNVIPFFNHRRNSVFYSTITEVIPNKHAIEKIYSYYDNIDPYIGRLPAINNLPKSNYGELRSNLLNYETLYNFENGVFKRFREKKINYDYNQVKSLKSYVFRENFLYFPHPGEDQLLNISHGFYENYYGFYLPTQTITKEYLPNGVVLETVSTENYNNPSHYQPTSQTTTFPDLSTSETTEYQYAHEKGNTYLTGKNIVGIPLETEVKKTANGITQTISKSLTNYPTSETEAKDRILNNTQNNDFPLPFDVMNKDLAGTSMEKQINYDYYDDQGNILQYTTNSGIPTAIVWGYNKTQPIAKIEGATYAQISSLATAIIDASDIDAAAAPRTDETTFLTALDNFRKAYADYQITTYTYDPLIGVRSITPPSGVRELYIYDNANRLLEIKDINGNILKEFKYNYKQ